MTRNEHSGKEALRIAADYIRTHPDPKVRTLAASVLTQARDRPLGRIIGGLMEAIGVRKPSVEP